ncbi:Alpha/Beta hydrolase protein [Halenospora varia]|nr:Alpha/Beta hydrolase protein [Halenospora varia]
MEKRPTVAEILAHPAYPDTLWNLTPTERGQLPVAAGRGGPFKIDWEVHGHGDVKLVWIMGLGSNKSSWQRQTLHFGHDEGDKYSSLIFDNRGMGKSDKPFMRYSTSEMAKDLVELLDHLGWTEPRQLNVSGVSMGGMIAQELAMLIPHRIASLNLISTAAQIQNTTTWLENLWSRIDMFLPKTLDASILSAAGRLFSNSWLSSPDESPVPTESTTMAPLPLGRSYRKFNTNYERFAAQELHKRLSPDLFPKLGFILQAIAAGWHYKSPAQLTKIGNEVGRARISVVHGTTDNMITVPHAVKLAAGLGLGEDKGTVEIKEGVGHVFMLERCGWHNELVERMVKKGMEENDKEGVSA